MEREGKHTKATTVQPKGNVRNENTGTVQSVLRLRYLRILATVQKSQPGPAGDLGRIPFLYSITFSPMLFFLSHVSIIAYKKSHERTLWSGDSKNGRLLFYFVEMGLAP